MSRYILPLAVGLAFGLLFGALFMSVAMGDALRTAFWQGFQAVAALGTVAAAGAAWVAASATRAEQKRQLEQDKLESQPLLQAVNARVDAWEDRSAGTSFELINFGNYYVFIYAIARVGPNLNPLYEPVDYEEPALVLSGGEKSKLYFRVSIGRPEESELTPEDQGEVRVYFLYGPTGQTHHYLRLPLLLSLNGSDSFAPDVSELNYTLREQYIESRNVKPANESYAEILKVLRDNGSFG